MRAIPTEPLCLTCHGKTLAPELAEAIAPATAKIMPTMAATWARPKRSPHKGGSKVTPPP